MELLEIAVSKFFNTPLQANRPFVLDQYYPPLAEIADDGLDNIEREVLLNYTLIDDTGNNSNQFESIAYFDTESRLGQSTFTDVIQRRIPPGKVRTYDELHKICGELCSGYRKWRKTDNSPIVFAIVPHEHGKYTYARLNVKILYEPKKK